MSKLAPSLPARLHNSLPSLLETKSETLHPPCRLPAEAVLGAGLVTDGTIAQDGGQAGAIWHLREGITEALRHRGAIYKWVQGWPGLGWWACLGLQTEGAT